MNTVGTEGALESGQRAEGAVPALGDLRGLGLGKPRVTRTGSLDH